MKLAIVIGTRPEIIKMFPIIKLCENRKIPFILIHSNQHYSIEMDSLIFQDLGVRKPDYNLEVGSGTQGQQTARILERIEAVFMKENPEYVLVHGDVNTTLGASLAAKKLLIKIGHVEAGLRSFDNRMPEEINRILVDHMSDDCFTPTISSKENLVKEGILEKKIHIVGNSIVDSCLSVSKIKKDITPFLNNLNLSNKNFLLLTLHRQENTDDPVRFKNLLESLKQISRDFGMKFLFPMHPRTISIMEKNKIILSNEFIPISAIGYVDFVKIMQNSKIIFTDSGGVQEEACILHIPCVTLRENTERPESVTVGANIVAGINYKTISIASQKMFSVNPTWLNPFGDGKTSEKILKVIGLVK